MDNMIHKLEKYTTNLEGIVSQRTGQLVEEKKKTELLLYRMLPQWVERTNSACGELWLANVGERFVLTHWGRVTHTCVNKLTIIGSDNGLSPGRRQAII